MYLSSFRPEGSEHLLDLEEHVSVVVPREHHAARAENDAPQVNPPVGHQPHHDLGAPVPTIS